MIENKKVLICGEGNTYVGWGGGVPDLAGGVPTMDGEGYLSLYGRTHSCENITFPILRIRTVIM